MTQLHGKSVSIAAKERNGKDTSLKISDEVSGQIHLVYYTFEDGNHKRHELFVSEHDFVKGIAQLKGLKLGAAKHAKKEDLNE